MPRMNNQEMVAFLDEPGHLARLGTIDETNGWPHVVPIWYLHQEGKIYITPRERSAWLAHIQSDSRVCMDIDDSTRKVIIRGRVEEVYSCGQNEKWRDIWWQMALRGMPMEAAILYTTSTAAEPRALWALDISKAETLWTWRPSNPSLGEDQLKWWATRYFTRPEGSRTAAP